MRLVPERRILVYVAAMMGGVTLATVWHDPPASPGMIAITACTFMVLATAGLHPAGGGLARWHPLMVGGAWCLAGVLSSLFHMSQLPAGLDDGSARVEVSGVVEHVDGRFDRRLRIWLRVSDVEGGSRDIVSRLMSRIVRLSVRPDEMNPRAGSAVTVLARVYPPPRRVLHGAPDYSLRARAGDVVASGYVIRPLSRDDDMQSSRGWSARLSAFRQARADRIVDGMTDPAGGIAAALLIGDRRYVSEATYDLFRGSGLAHLLAISGLHMGLLCFGLIGFLRGLAALIPSLACRVPVHKYAALAGIVAGFAYLLLSGLPISAIRAFLMAMLILAAWLIDRLGLTVRNVGLAAGVILLVSPVALFSAGYQLSFAATMGLVIWFESWRARQASGGGGGGGVTRIRRWGLDLITASLIAGAATLPLTAYHFGAITPWGVIANLVGIPLTGLWIMPAGLVVLITGVLPVPAFLFNLALLVMQGGIDALVLVAGLFAALPASPLLVTPPTPVILIIGYGGVGLLLCVAADRWLAVTVATSLAIGVATCIMLRPPIDGILFARGPDTHLVLPAADGTASVFSARRGRRLSDYLADNAGRSLARAVDTHHGDRDITIFPHADGIMIAVVTARGALTAGCRSRVTFVIATVRADYPCRDGKPLVSLAGVPPDNYLLRFGRQDVQARASGGQYFLISPVSRP